CRPTISHDHGAQAKPEPRSIALLTPACGSRGRAAMPERVWAANQDLSARAPTRKRSNGPELTEDAIASLFAEKYRSQLRYCHDTGDWSRWNGHIWHREATPLAFDWCRATCRLVGEGQKIFGKASTASGVERFARADRAFAVTAAIWDKDLFLLGTP